jgi:hemin transport system ATP-binding protein
VDDYSPPELQQLRSAKIGFIFQTFYLIDSLNAIENVSLVMKFTHTPKKQACQRATELLDLYGVKHLLKAYPHTMSQGEKQRVAVARAMANNPQMVIADEPTGSLATDQGMKIVEFLRDSAKNQGRCVIIASHDQRIGRYADRIYYLQDGELLSDRN